MEFMLSADGCLLEICLEQPQSTLKHGLSPPPWGGKAVYEGLTA
jgi:hypothetical protein